MNLEKMVLPGTIPGLLRRGSPVVGHMYDAERVGVVAYVHPVNGGVVAWGVGLSGLPSNDWGAIHLDLTDATGRAHAAWWLAKAFDARWSKAAIHGVWNLTTLAQNPAYLTTYGARNAWVTVPSLADLDPNDPRLLPDGSRWVDAEALRRVCLDVAGVKS